MKKITSGLSPKLKEHKKIYKLNSGMIDYNASPRIS